jgi:hypothetical protein
MFGGRVLLILIKPFLSARLDAERGAKAKRSGFKINPQVVHFE